MAHEVICNSKPDHGNLDLDPEMLQAAADEISSAEHARSRRERLAEESFIGTVLFPILRRARAELSNGFDIGWFLAKK
ncbi:MAG: hypothetical protein K5837_00175 [Candidatus Saccharibacteria bacterium]|nr:hypothetical protein [Candidatus Saccharibacteria bacterium]